MAKKSILGTSLLLATLGLATPLYSQNPLQQEAQQTPKYTLEQITSENPPEDLTREDYLEELIKILGPKYEKMKKDPYLKEKWNRNWENAPLKRLRAVVNLYNPKLNPIPQKEILDKRFEEISTLNFAITMSYFFWMEYGEHGEKLTPIEKAIFIQYDRDLKEIQKYRTTRSK